MSISSELFSVVRGREGFFYFDLVDFLSEVVLLFIKWAITALSRFSTVASSLWENIYLLYSPKLVLSQVLAWRNFPLMYIIIYLSLPISQSSVAKSSVLFLENFLLALFSVSLLSLFLEPKS
jgi:hypothetical protein